MLLERVTKAKKNTIMLHCTFVLLFTILWYSNIS